MRLLRSALVPVCAALCSALCAHIAIDIAGDHLLAHDTYDDIAHTSRPIAAAVAFALALIVTVGTLWGIVREARGSDDRFCRLLKSLLPDNRYAFAAIVAMVSPLLLVAMEWSDATMAGQPPEDALALFGGSIALGATITFGSSLIVASVAWATIGLIARRRRALIAFVVVFLLRRRSLPFTPLRTRRARPAGTARNTAYGLHRIGRAPPTLSLAD